MTTWVPFTPTPSVETSEPVLLRDLLDELLAYLDAPARQKTLRRLPYADYLQSDHWRIVRAHILEQRGGHCERCGALRDLNVHHLTYERLGAEEDTDLEVLCRSCHEAEHGIVHEAS